MDIDTALNTLDLFARGEPVNVHQACQAANLVSRYVEFLELFSSPDAVLASRKDLRLVTSGRPQEGASCVTGKVDAISPRPLTTAISVADAQPQCRTNQTQ